MKKHQCLVPCFRYKFTCKGEAEDFFWAKDTIIGQFPKTRRNAGECSQWQHRFHIWIGIFKVKKKSHLLKLLKMDLHRCIGAKRFPVIIALIVVLLIANVWESVMIELQYKMRMMGSLEKLMELLIFDRFKAAVIVLLSAVYTFGLCDDRNNSYDRLILFRCRQESICCQS